MKKCTICGQEKSLDNFYDQRAGKFKKASECKPCVLKRHKSRYWDNHAQIRNAQNDSATKRRQEFTLKLVEYLKEHPCVDCGETNPIVLDFDHIDPTTKTSNVPRLTRYSWRRVIEEMQKCEVRCANCHRIRTARQLGYYKGEYYGKG